MSYYESDDLRDAEAARERDDGLRYEDWRERVGADGDDLDVSIGDEVLVDCTPYGVEGRCWCRVELLAPGATPYPIRARVPGRGLGQWAPDEVQGIRGPAVL